MSGSCALKGKGALRSDESSLDLSDIHEYRARPVFEKFRLVSVWKSEAGHGRVKIGLSFESRLKDPGRLWRETFSLSRFVLEVNDRDLGVMHSECHFVEMNADSVKWHDDSVSFEICPADEGSAEILRRALSRAASHVPTVRNVTVHFTGGRLVSKPIRHRFAS